MSRCDTSDLDTAADLSERAWRRTRSQIEQEHPGHVRLAAAFAEVLLARVDSGGQVGPELSRALRDR